MSLVNAVAMSAVNAIQRLGRTVEYVTKPEQITTAKVLVFPGVGAFGSAMQVLHEKGFVEPLKEYIAADRPYLGICIGMQALFEESEESPGVKGVGVIPGKVSPPPCGCTTLSFIFVFMPR